MLDKRSRKVLKYIKKHGQASFHELLELDSNKALMAQILVKLNDRGYTIITANKYAGNQKTVYELQEKGYGELEDYRRQAIQAYAPIIISILSLVISIMSFIQSGCTN